MNYIKIMSTLAVFSTLSLATTYEDAEGTSAENWRVIDDRPSGACFSKVYNDDRASNVIELDGYGMKNAYILGAKRKNRTYAWHNEDERTFSWSMNFNEKYRLTLFVHTKKGLRKFNFVPKNKNSSSCRRNSITIGLNKSSMNGTWQDFSYDIDELLEEYEPNNRVISINGLRVRGSGKIDDIKLISSEDTNCMSKVDLGEALYFDKSLSFNRTMACATCHHPDAGFIDIRESPIGYAAALSADSDFIATRNVPTNSYAAFTPIFKSAIKEGTTEKIYIGGQFLDGRAKDLKAQAKGPFLNPVEMQMPNPASVIERVKENPSYIESLKDIYGDDIFNSVDNSYDAIADAIATFEKTDLFSPFDSKYDRMLNGEYIFTEEEQEGLAIFSDINRGKCAKCHTLSTDNSASAPLFTNHKYHNLGLGKNLELLEANGKGSDFLDHGLLENPEVTEASMDGKFKISTLRNVAMTSPYMHNGIFEDLKTVVHFYNTRDVAGAINPETGEPWRTAEIPATVNHKLLGNLKLTNDEEDALVAFMETLTDKRYEDDEPEVVDVESHNFCNIKPVHVEIKPHNFCNIKPKPHNDGWGNYFWNLWCKIF